MLLTRMGVFAGLAAGALALTACGSDNTAATPPAGNTDSAAAPASSASSGSTGPSDSVAPASSAAAVSCGSGTLNADGSTAQQNAMGEWAKGYQAKCSGTTINYSGGGSGQGVTDFKGGKVDFAGSDSALDPTKNEPADSAKRCASPALDLPMVVGPIAIAFKLNGVTDLTMDGDLLTKIFLGKVKTWNDPLIKAANPSATLPSTAITVVYRSDQSGTTNNFEKYLAAADPTDYTSKPSKVWAGKVGQGKSGSQGVQQALTSTEGSIGYIEYSFALNGNLDTAKVNNGAAAVALTPASAAAAAGAATVTGTGGDLTLKIDYKTKAAGAYPIILITYELACTKYADAKKGAFVKSFLTYTAGDGQAALNDLGYAPLPSALLAKVQASIATIS